MTHVTSLLLGLGNGGVYAAPCDCVGPHLSQFGRRQLRDGNDRAVHRVHLRVAPRGRLAHPHSWAPDEGRRRTFTRLRTGRAPRAGAHRRASRAAVHARFPTSSTGTRPGARVASLGVLVVLGGLIREPRRRVAGQCFGDLPVEVLALGIGSRAVRSLLSRNHHLRSHAGAHHAISVNRFGLLTRAAAETQLGAIVSGVSPDRIALLNWMASAVVAGIAGILIAPISPLTPSAYALAVVPTLAAAAVGQFEYMVPAVGAGIAIGMLQSEASTLAAQHSWLPQSGSAELIPLLVIFGALLVE